MYKVTPIGIIHSPFREPKEVPIQSSAARDIEGRIEVYQEYITGLEDLDGFSHIILIYYFHLSKDYSLKVKPFMDNTLRGVFATRAPSRPNPLGLSIVRLMKINENILYIKDVDIVDNTPLLDIKPFVPEFDSRNNIRIGWLKENIYKLSKSKDDGRFIK